jgi:hypothetical protein
MSFFADLNSNKFSLVPFDGADVLFWVNLLHEGSSSCRWGAPFRKGEQLHRKSIHVWSDAIELEGRYSSH